MKIDRSAPEDVRHGQMLLQIEEFRRRRPRLIDEHITMAHGAGGKSSAALTENVFVEAFRNPALEQLGDGALLTLPSGEQLAFSTDSYVVQPLEFPGGSIAELAINGTVNDLAVSGAKPQWISAAFVIEEGFSISKLKELAQQMAKAADAIGVHVVTGDTKVVPVGKADGVYITTAGIGIVPAGRKLGADLVEPGDRVICSGPIAAHGMAIMIARGNLDIEADIVSDTAPVNAQCEALLAAVPQTRWMRDATRGGVGTVANELAMDSGLGVILDEESIPIDPTVLGCCDLLGIDPIHVANEGRFIAVVPANEVDAALNALRATDGGQGACVIGEIVSEPKEIVAMRTPYGGTRIVDMLVGDPLPRIC